MSLIGIDERDPQERFLFVTNIATSARRTYQVLSGMNFLVTHDQSNNLILGGSNISSLGYIALATLERMAAKTVRVREYMHIPKIRTVPLLDYVNRYGLLYYTSVSSRFVVVDLVGRTSRAFCKKSDLNPVVGLGCLEDENILVVSLTRDQTIVTLSPTAQRVDFLLSGAPPGMLLLRPGVPLNLATVNYLTNDGDLCQFESSMSLRTLFKVTTLHNFVRVCNNVFILFDEGRRRWLAIRLDPLEPVF